MKMSHEPESERIKKRQGPENVVEATLCSLTAEKTEWLTSEEAAEYLRISVATLRNMTSNGKIPFYKLGRRNRYNRSDLRKVLSSQPRGLKYGN